MCAIFDGTDDFSVLLSGFDGNICNSSQGYRRLESNGL